MLTKEIKKQADECNCTVAYEIFWKTKKGGKIKQSCHTLAWNWWKTGSSYLFLLWVVSEVKSMHTSLPKLSSSRVRFLWQKTQRQKNFFEQRQKPICSYSQTDATNRKRHTVYKKVILLLTSAKQKRRFSSCSKACSWLTHQAGRQAYKRLKEIHTNYIFCSHEREEESRKGSSRPTERRKRLTSRHNVHFIPQQ